MAKRMRIALLIDTATSWGSGLIQGISEFAHAVADWQFFLGPRGKYDRFNLPRDWHGDGVIARVNHPELAAQILERGLTAVNVSWYRYGGTAIPQCTCDERLIAKMAVEFLLARGLRQFAYCGSALRRDYNDRLQAAFVEQLRLRSLHCESFEPTLSSDPYLPSETDLQHLADWLISLPKPVGLLAFDSLQARQVTEACYVSGLNVPAQVAVLGGEHDSLSCTISKPELSSIDHDPRRVGWAAAELLASLLDGVPPPLSPVLLPPTRVIARQSTDLVAVADDLVSLAIRFVYEHCSEPIRVRDILKQVPLSRRALEKGFRKAFGRTPAEAIRYARVEQAVQLLCDTSWAMPRIAANCGFERPELMTRAFRRELDTTPSEFRRRHLRNSTGSAAPPRLASVPPARGPEN